MIISMQWGNFIIYNVIVTLLASATFFLMKDFQRIQQNKLTNISIMIFGSIIGILISLVNIFLVMKISMNVNISGNIITQSIELTSSVILIILFSVMIDLKLYFPIVIWVLIGIIIEINWELFDISNTNIWISLIWTSLTFVILTFFIFIIQSQNLFKKNGFKFLLIVSIYIITTIIISILETLTLSKNIFQQIILDIINLFYLILITLFQYIFIYIIEKIYKNFNNLETFSIKDNVSYYKMSLAQKELKYYINQKKIERGVILLFYVKSSNLNNEQFSNILDELKTRIEISYDDTFFFKATLKYYGVFFKLKNDFSLMKIYKNNKLDDRTPDDPLRFISEAFKKTSKRNNVKINAGASIYGIHSYDISELIEYCKYILSSVVIKSNQSNIIVYDFKRVKERLNESIEVSGLPINIKKMSISYIKGISDEKVYYSEISFENIQGKKENINDILKKLTSNREKEIFLRFIAFQTLKKFDKKDSSLIIFYSEKYLFSELFDSKEFLRKVSRYISLDKLLIGLTSFNPISKIGLKNIDILKKNGIQFAFSYTKEINQEMIDQINPKYLFTINENNSIFKKNSKLVVDIETDAIYLNVNLV